MSLRNLYEKNILNLNQKKICFRDSHIPYYCYNEYPGFSNRFSHRHETTYLPHYDVSCFCVFVHRLLLTGKCFPQFFASQLLSFPRLSSMIVSSRKPCLIVQVELSVPLLNSVRFCLSCQYLVSTLREYMMY